MNVKCMHTSYVTLQFRYLLDKVKEKSSRNQAAEFNTTPAKHMDT